MSGPGGGPLRVLVVHQGILRGRDEALEVRELTAGLIEAAAVHDDITVDVCNGKVVFDASVVDGQLILEPRGGLRCLRGPRYDVAHLHLAIIPRQVAIAALLRVRRTRIVFSPMSMLGDDFTNAAWFRHARGPWSRVKALLVALLRWAWLLVTHVFVVASAEEQQQARLPAHRCVQVPLAAPDSALATAALAVPADEVAPVVGPVAFTSRLDAYRKGFDRLAAWVEAYADDLPRPAVLLLAPTADDAPAGLVDLVDRGLITWDPEARGADVAAALRGCRAQMLLSRWDGQPRVLREAVLMGVPTISTVSSHFAEVVDLVGNGAIVDGDDPADIQRAFEATADQPRVSERGRAVFDRQRIGRYLLDVLFAAAHRTLPQPTSYYAYEPESLP